MDLRPSNLAWHPDGQTIAFTADPDWRNELRYNSPDLWTVTIDGKVTRLTNDGYVYGDVGYSPDGQYLSYSRSFGTDMIIEKRLNHGGPQDLYVRRSRGGEPINLTAAWDLDPGPDALVAGQPVHLLHRGHRRRDAPVPRLGAGRARRAGDEGSAPRRPGSATTRRSRGSSTPSACTRRRRSSTSRTSTVRTSAA